MSGLLQTADYARAVVRAAVPKWVPQSCRAAGRRTHGATTAAPGACTCSRSASEATLRGLGDAQILAGSAAHAAEKASNNLSPTGTCPERPRMTSPSRVRTEEDWLRLPNRAHPGHMPP